MTTYINIGPRDAGYFNRSILKKGQLNRTEKSELHLAIRIYAVVKLLLIGIAVYAAYVEP